MYSSKSTQFLKTTQKSTFTDKNYLIAVTWVFVIRYFTPLITYYVKSWTRIAEQSKASICVYKAYTIFFFLMTYRFAI